MPYIPYTDEQKQLANSVDLPTFLRIRGETLVPVGREFKLIYHDDTASTTALQCVAHSGMTTRIRSAVARSDS